MKILCVSATKLEIDPLLRKLLEISDSSDNHFDIRYKGHRIKFLITGIGSVHTIYHLSRVLANKKYDMVLNLGICGSFRDEIPLGEVIYVKQEIFADLGFEEMEGFMTLFEAGMIEKSAFPYTEGRLDNLSKVKEKSLISLKNVVGITVNKSSGSYQQAKFLKMKFGADIESMEGASFFYTCLQENIPFAEIRSVSNMVGERDKGSWNISLATNNLSDLVLNYFEEI